MDSKKVCLILAVLTVFLTPVFSQEPILSFHYKNLNLKVPPGASLDDSVTVTSFLGSEPVGFYAYIFGDLLQLINFDEDYFVIQPNSTRDIPIKVRVPQDAVLKVYNGSVRLSTPGGQFLVFNFSVNVSNGLGRVVLEALSNGEIPSSFNASLIDSSGGIVDSSLVTNGYWFSKYVPYGSYSVKVESNSYDAQESSFNLLTPEKNVLMILSERKGPFLSVEPHDSYVEVCPSKADFSTVRLRNDGFEALNVTARASNSIISVDSQTLSLAPGEFRDLKFGVTPLPTGSYESSLIVSHLGFESVVRVFITILPKTSCETKSINFNVDYQNTTVMPTGLEHFFLVTVTPDQPAGILKLEELSADYPISITPKYYSSVKKSQLLPFLVRTISSNSSEGFVILKIKTDRGEESILLKGYSRDLNSSIILVEVGDLRKLLSIFENKLLSLESDNKAALLKISQLKFDLDEASSLLGSDNSLAKVKVDKVLNDTIVFFDYFSQKKTGQNEYLLLGVLSLMLVLFAIAIVKRKEVRMFLKKFRNKP